jgi:predicted PurR-regulated permease PerM
MGIGSIIACAIYAAALRLSIDQLLGPLAFGTTACLHPVMCFVAGGVLFDITGAIMAVPVAISMKTCLAALYDEPLEPNEAERNRNCSE